MILPTEKMIEALEFVIAQAWNVNAEVIYPVDQDYPDPKAMLNIAATAVATTFCGWVADAREKNSL